MGFLKLAIFVILVTFCNAVPFNDLPYCPNWPSAHRYPNSCCQLEWTYINFGDPLPEDYIEAGTYSNRKYAYTRSNYPSIAFQSDQPNEDANWMGFSSNKQHPFAILTNPNKCTIGWYTSRFYGEEVPIRKNWFFPSIGYSRYGDFVRYSGIPAFTSGGPVCYMDSLTTRNCVNADHYDLLYVDCLASITTMSNSRIYNITYDTNMFGKLRGNQMVYTKKTVINDSPKSMMSNFKFQIENSDNASMRLKTSHASFFKTTSETYQKWSINGGVNGGIGSFLKFFGFSLEAGYQHESWQTSETQKSDFEENEVFKTSAHREMFESSQNLEVPPFSKTVITAFSKPIQGAIDINMIYELTPRGNVTNAKMLQATLHRYGLNEKTELTDRGTLLVHFDATMEVAAGEEVNVSIESTPIPNRNWTQFDWRENLV